MEITGIPKLDDAIGGVFPKGYNILFYAEPGVENLEFAQQIGFNFLKNKQKCIYFVNNKKPEIVLEMFENYGWDIKNNLKNKSFSMIDSYTPMLGLKSGVGVPVSAPTDINSISSAITKSIKTNKNSVMIIDALTNLLDMTELNVLIEHMGTWKKEAKRNNVHLIFLFTEWAYEEGFKQILRDHADIVVDLKAIERNIILRKYFSVSKFDNKAMAHKDIPFRVFSPGGVKVYIPKLLVTGPFHAGKTSFIHSLSEHPVSVNRLGTTIALDFGHADINGFSVDLFGTPGQQRFDPILKLLGGEALGVVLVVDSTKPSDFPRAKEMLELTKTAGLPVVIAANKSNLKGALSIAQIRKKMNLPAEYPILPVVADNLKSVKEGEPCKLKKEGLRTIMKKLLERVV
jgi:small GTP-binding protein